MTYLISSASSGKSMTTKDPLKDAAWGNEYYGVTDCVRVEVVEPTQADVDKAEALMMKKCEIRELELKNLRKLYDGEDMTAVNAERVKLRNEIKALDGRT